MDPTGQPFWISAAELRSKLQAMRSALDPQRRNLNLDRMALVSHSMGGLAPKLQVVEGGDAFLERRERETVPNRQSQPEGQGPTSGSVLLPPQFLDSPRRDHRHPAPRQRVRQSGHTMAVRNAHLAAASAGRRTNRTVSGQSRAVSVQLVLAHAQPASIGCPPNSRSRRRC